MAYTKQTWADLDPSKVVSAERLGVMEQGIADAHELAGANVASFVITDDGTTTRGYNLVTGLLHASGTSSDVVVQTCVNVMDPVNGGNGGRLFLRKQSAGSGYRWAKEIRLPLELTGKLKVECEAGVIIIPQSIAGFPLFTNQRTVVNVGTAGFTDDATIYLTSLTGSNGKVFPASGQVSVSSHLVSYTGTASDAPGGGPRLTGCTYTGSAFLVVGTGNAALTYTAVTQGSGGTDVTIAYVVSGTNTPLTIGVAASAITVNVATDGAGLATSTALQVAAAIRASAAAAALVNVMLSASSGASVVAAVGATALSTHAATTTANSVILAHENHRRIELDLTGAIVDCTNLAGTANPYSILYGQLQAGGWNFYGMRLNIADVTVRGGELINCPTNRVHYPVYIASQQRNIGETTQNVIREPRIFNTRAGTPTTPAGSCTAYAIAGKSTLDATVVCNILIDDYEFRGNHAHSNFSAGNYVGITSIQVGGTALTGVGYIEENDLRGSFDVNVEVDNNQKAAYVRGNNFEDPKSEAVLFYVFTGGTAPGNPRWENSGNHVRSVNQLGRYFRCYSGPSNQEETFRGTIIDSGNTVDWSGFTGTIGNGVVQIAAAYGQNNNAIKARTIISEGNTVELGSGITLSGNGAINVWQIATQTGAPACVVAGAKPNLVRGSVAYAVSATGNVQTIQHQGPVVFADPCWVTDVTVSGSPPAGNAIRCYRLGVVAGSTLQGRIRLRVLTATGCTNPTGVEVGGTALLSFTTPLVVEYDGSGLAATTAGNEILYDATSNLGKVWFTPTSSFKVARASATPTYAGTGVPTVNATGHWCTGYVTGGTVTAVGVTNTGASADNRATGLAATGVCVGMVPPEGGIQCTSSANPTITYIPIHAGPLA
jgi:hypothetical protein